MHSKQTSHPVWQPLVPGATVLRNALGGVWGTRFVVWAPDATAVHVCWHPGTHRLALAAQGDGLWAVDAPGIGPGQLYALQADGPWQPEAGHRFTHGRLLLDPWARALADPGGHAFDELALTGTAATVASADAIPWCVVVDAPAVAAAAALATSATCPSPASPTPRTLRPASDVVLYEAHVKALTRLHPALPPALRGTYAGLAHPAVTTHLRQLGVTTLCLLPVHTFITERHLLQKGLTNHWGYNPLNVFAPHHGYAACTGGQAPRDAQEAAAIRQEFADMVAALHAAGLEVVLDVVFNHTCESDLDGPTLSWRGLGHGRWYRLDAHGQLLNHSGCGNSLDTSQPRVIQWVMDSLRWWVQALGVDGFRFDLAVSLGRESRLPDQPFYPHHPLLAAMAQDPVLAATRRIAEPWDLGPWGHRTGQFGAGWQEWNDAFRDTVRAFWLGHPCTRGELATRLCASGDLFGQQADGPRPPTASVQFITAHDGFTLHDLTAYTQRHNHANGEDNRDGHAHNLSTHCGVEGPTADAAVRHRRTVLQRALLATLLCAQGTPQLLAGDELAHSCQGNNNVYCQDNALTWLNWANPGEHTAFIAHLTALRRELPALRHPLRLTGLPVEQQATHPNTYPNTYPNTHPIPPSNTHRPPFADADITWLDVDAQPMQAAAWQDPHHRTLCALVCVGEHGQPPTERVWLLWHASDHALNVQLPPGNWTLRLHSAEPQRVQHAAPLPDTGRANLVAGQLAVHEPCVCVLVQSLPPVTADSTGATDSLTTLTRTEPSPAPRA